MDFNEVSNLTTIGLEGCGCLIMITIAYKLYKMKIHSRSGCCGDRFVIETMNKAGSSRDLNFSDANKNNAIEKNSNAII